MAREAGLLMYTVSGGHRAAKGYSAALHLGRFDVPILVFALSALVGALAAYDSLAAGRKLVLVWGGVATYGLLSRIPSHVVWDHRHVPLLRLLVGLAPAFLSAYFLLTNEWAHPVAKVAWLEPLRGWLAHQAFRLPLPALHPILVGGLLAMWLPLQVAALGPRPRHRGEPRHYDPVGLPQDCSGCCVLCGPFAE